MAAKGRGIESLGLGAARSLVGVDVSGVAVMFVHCVVEDVVEFVAEVELAAARATERGRRAELLLGRRMRARKG